MAGLDVGQEAFQGEPVHITAGEAAVVVALGHFYPASVALAGHIGLGGFALGIQGVELLFQAFLGGLAGIDGTAYRGGDRTVGSLGHGLPPGWPKRKKRKPLQWEPVMALATALSER